MTRERSKRFNDHLLSAHALSREGQDQNQGQEVRKLKDSLKYPQRAHNRFSAIAQYHENQCVNLGKFMAASGLIKTTTSTDQNITDPLPCSL